MFAVDDLRTQLSVYPEGGAMHTPTFDRIAKQAVVFERAYVAVALCMPSRTALLTGRRPDTSRSWTIEPDQWFRHSGGNWTTLPGAFKKGGYLTLGMGKIFHETVPASDPQDARVSWSAEAYFDDGGQRKRGGLYDPPGDEPRMGGKGLAHRFPDADEPRMQDGNLTLHAIATIEKMAAGGFGADVAAGERPFFLAVGFHKPHVPWYAPGRFWDLYPLEKVPPTPHPGLPTAAVPVALQDWQALGFCGEEDMKPMCEPLTTAYPLDNTTFRAAAQLYARQAYFASVSWTDANIGRVLDAFEATPLAKDYPVVCVWGDHGWHLGDNDLWAKMCGPFATVLPPHPDPAPSPRRTNFEHATKIPLLIGCAGRGCAGRTRALVSSLDIMPTLLEEAGLTVPHCPTSHAASRSTDFCVEGRSLSPLLRDPGAAGHFDAAYSQFPRPEHPGRMVDLSCRDDPKQQHSCTQGFCNDGCLNKMVSATVRPHCKEGER